MKNYLLSPGIEPTISISRDSHIDQSSTLAQVIVGISCIYVWTTTALKDWLYFPTIKIRPVVQEKQLSGSQIRISIRITTNFELGLPMIITSLLTKFHQNPTSSLWEILLTNKQTDRHTKVIAISRFSRDKNTSSTNQYDFFSDLVTFNTDRVVPCCLSKHILSRISSSYYRDITEKKVEITALCLKELIV